MAAACFAVLLGTALPAAAARAPAGRDAAGFTQRLGGLLQAAQMNLARAEAHHEKAVKHARQDSKALFLREARDLGGAVGRYSAELKESEDELSHAVDSARAAAKKSAAAESSTSWTNPAVEAHARLLAQTESAARTARAAERKRGRLVREAEVRAERAIEDVGERLSRRMGDLTPEVDEAKSSLEAEERSAVEAGAKAAAGAKKPSAGAAEGAALKSAEARSREAAAAAEKRLGAALQSADGALQAGARDVEARLQAAEREEIKGVRGASYPLGSRPAKPSTRGHHA